MPEDVYKRQIRDSLFSIQVEQPWLLLQFGNSNTEEIGADRVEALVSASPEDEDGKTREEVVKTEIEDNDNNNLTIPQVVNRLGMVFFLLFFNLGITIFVFLLTGMMLFSQILFIIFAMFLPISFLLSTIVLVRVPGSYLASRLFAGTLLPMGLAAPAGSLLSVMICVAAYRWMKRRGTLYLSLIHI